MRRMPQIYGGSGRRKRILVFLLRTVQRIRQGIGITGTAAAAEAMAAMEQAMEDVYGNASAVYRTAARAKQLLEQSREIIAETIGASPEEIFFTSGGTESDNWALNAAADRAAGQDGSDEIRFRTGAQIRPQIITTPIEHHAILHTLSYLQSSGRAEAMFADVDEAGRVNQEAVCSRITPQTALVSVMMANNEIGTIEPIREIARRVHDAEERQILFHTDAGAPTKSADPRASAFCISVGESGSAHFCTAACRSGEGGQGRRMSRQRRALRRPRHAGSDFEWSAHRI